MIHIQQDITLSCDTSADYNALLTYVNNRMAAIGDITTITQDVANLKMTLTVNISGNAPS